MKTKPKIDMGECEGGRRQGQLCQLQGRLPANETTASKGENSATGMTLPAIGTTRPATGTPLSAIRMTSASYMNDPDYHRYFSEKF